MDFEVSMRLLTAAAVMLGIINTIAVWMQWGRRELTTKVEGIRETLDEQDGRIQAIESELKHLPSKQDVHDLKISVTEMSGKLGAFDTELGSVGRTVRRIEDHLLGTKP
ncbi:DUF2730 family protein [Sphingobium lignivorans]|uniref:Cell division protein FtsL n=1 Tax=Sphingobium lignivorans TaxID=2735886 RepID=A0ABR6NJF7_9SPHN|nr:DUF2730 family protein [Sphingobium lignivorans]MBB5987417.1 cell division protein FtsL [Sphingobium lignivorans]